jgi:hypothetical protein
MSRGSLSSSITLDPLAPATTFPPRERDAAAPDERLPLRAWLLASALFLAAYASMWMFVHAWVDTHPCLGHPPDPLYRLIPADGRWSVVSHELYSFVTLVCLGALVVSAARGRHRPLVRWGAALAFQAMERSVCMMLLPLCRYGVAAGTCAATSVPTVRVLGCEIPWRMWATNDLVFSGHVGEVVLLLAATPRWPPWTRRALLVYQAAQIYALIATRGHYTIDLLLAVPCALFADRLAVRGLDRVAGRDGATQRATSGAQA